MQLRLIPCVLVIASTVGCTKTVTLKETEPVNVSARAPEPPPPPAPPPPERVEVQRERIQVNETIHFEYNSAKIRGESDSLLAEIAQVINDHPELVKIRIEGHTDNIGSAGFNQDLSQRRAQSVRDHLVAKGSVDPNRLTTAGYGFDQPIASNDTDEGRSQNRRVEFDIVERNDELARPLSEGESEATAGDATDDGAADDDAADDDAADDDATDDEGGER
jgi:outer membrane protein OmpA-like peptidoglycan-associated protein